MKNIFLIIYYILYKYYKKLLTKLITDANQPIQITSNLLNLKYIYIEYNFFLDCYKKLKIIDKQHNNIIFLSIIFKYL